MKTIHPMSSMIGRLALAAILSCSTVLLSAQHVHTERCGQQAAVENLKNIHPENEQSIAEARDAAREYLERGGRTLRVTDDENTLYIPVVVHVVYANEAQNISDEQVLSQIEVLNDDFNMENDDFGVIRTDFVDSAGDVNVRFCMAEFDPLGAPSDGIDRVMTTEVSFDSGDTPNGWDNVKQSSTMGADAWPRNDYLNIWVCNLDPSSGVLGYAYPPGVTPSWRDGVVIHYRYFGKVGVVSPPYNLGRTTTHEVGHWLGLRHIWGDGGCSVDDGHDDTPASNTSHFGCPPATTASCGSLDMWENFMDYTDDRCMWMFSEDQALSMRSVLETTRATLQTSGKCWQVSGVNDQVDISADIHVFPNPANSATVRVTMAAPSTSEVVINLVDLTGRVLQSQLQPAGFLQTDLQVDGLPAGFYLVQVEGQDLRGSVKLLRN